jgi:hypothetical protein
MMVPLRRRQGIQRVIGLARHPKGHPPRSQSPSHPVTQTLGQLNTEQRGTRAVRYQSGAIPDSRTQNSRTQNSRTPGAGHRTAEQCDTEQPESDAGYGSGSGGGLAQPPPRCPRRTEPAREPGRGPRRHRPVSSNFTLTGHAERTAPPPHAHLGSSGRQAHQALEPHRSRHRRQAHHTHQAPHAIPHTPATTGATHVKHAPTHINTLTDTHAHSRSEGSGHDRLRHPGADLGFDRTVRR